TPGPQFAGRRAEQVPAGAVELTDAAEPGRERDVGHAQVRVVEQPAGKGSPLGSSELVGSDTRVIGEEPPKMPRRDPEAGTELGLRAAVEGAVEDQAHGPADELRADVTHRGRGPVRTAPEASP